MPCSSASWSEEPGVHIFDSGVEPLELAADATTVLAEFGNNGAELPLLWGVYPTDGDLGHSVTISAVEPATGVDTWVLQAGQEYVLLPGERVQLSVAVNTELAAHEAAIGALWTPDDDGLGFRRDDIWPVAQQCVAIPSTALRT